MSHLPCLLASDRELFQHSLWIVPGDGVGQLELSRGLRKIEVRWDRPQKGMKAKPRLEKPGGDRPFEHRSILRDPTRLLNSAETSAGRVVVGCYIIAFDRILQLFRLNVRSLRQTDTLHRGRRGTCVQLMTSKFLQEPPCSLKIP